MILRQLYFITNESLLYKQQKTKAWDKFTLTLPSMKVFRISGRDVRCGLHARGVAVASMKVFRISGRDPRLGCHQWLIRASMKVFRISGRDTETASVITLLHVASMKVFRISRRDGVTTKTPGQDRWCLNESLPHKRKRRGACGHTASLRRLPQ